MVPPMDNPTMHKPGSHFVACTEVGLMRGCEFRAVNRAVKFGFELNFGTPDKPRWIACGEPVGFPADVTLNYAVLDGGPMGAVPKP